MQFEFLCNRNMLFEEYFAMERYLQRISFLRKCNGNTIFYGYCERARGGEAVGRGGHRDVILEVDKDVGQKGPLLWIVARQVGISLFGDCYELSLLEISASCVLAKRTG
uniref:Uncharacterized protein n=1 Tax=Vespula pensylvanica TaxID=30213 RepID=A0A834JRL6_VESPE|nr:hypothetical protein H0235_017111 [Vespula pensylvanica]